MFFTNKILPRKKDKLHYKVIQTLYKRYTFQSFLVGFTEEVFVSLSLSPNLSENS